MAGKHLVTHETLRDVWHANEEVVDKLAVGGFVREGRHISAVRRAIQAFHQSVLVDKDPVPGVEFGRQIGPLRQGAERFDRPHREVDLERAVVLDDVAHLVDSHDLSRPHRIPVRDENASEVFDPAVVRRVWLDVANSENQVVVGERVNGRSRYRAGAGEDCGPDILAAVHPRNDAIEHWVARKHNDGGRVGSGNDDALIVEGRHDFQLATQRLDVVANGREARAFDIPTLHARNT